MTGEISIRRALALLFFLVALAPNSPAQTNGGQRQMHFRVVDTASDQPVSGVKLRARVASNLVTGPDGSCSIPLPMPKEGDFYYRITLTKDGYVGKIISWSRFQKDRIEDMPVEYTTKMEKAVILGGVIKNQKGEPIPGAKITLSGPPPSGQERERSVVAPNYH